MYRVQHVEAWQRRTSPSFADGFQILFRKGDAAHALTFEIGGAGYSEPRSLSQDHGKKDQCQKAIRRDRQDSLVDRGSGGPNFVAGSGTSSNGSRLPLNRAQPR